MTEEKQPIPPQDEWPNLSASQLFEMRTLMMNRYFDLRAMNASFADQYLAYAKHVDVLMERLELIRQQEQLEARQ